MFIKEYEMDTSVFEKEGEYERMLSEIAPTRREKALRLIREEPRRLSVLASYLLRLAFEENGYPGEDNRLQMGENGKLLCSPSCPLYFNISHSNTRVYVVLSDVPVGCDIEYADPSRAKDTFAKNVFAPQEYLYISYCEDHTAFYLLWTLKEAYLKMKGTGFTDNWNVPFFDTLSYSLRDSKAEIYKNEIKGDYAYAIVYKR